MKKKRLIINPLLTIFNNYLVLPPMPLLLAEVTVDPILSE